MKIAVASEHRGFRAKDAILSHVRDLQHQGVDYGPTSGEMCDYPDYASAVALAVSQRTVDRAILIGGTGIGMSIVANKFPGVRAALCYDPLSAEMSRRHNDANILCLSVDLLGEDMAFAMIKIWLTTEFEAGHHTRRVEKISQQEREICERRAKSRNGT